MGSRRRTDLTYVKMRTTTARDNAMYRITDTWNLDGPKETPMSPFRDIFSEAKTTADKNLRN